MKTRFLFPILLLTLTITLTACASKEKPPRERDETFVGDINPFNVGTFHLYASFGISRPKVCDFYATFYPRSNMLYLKGQVGIDIVQAGFSFNERKSISSAKDKYLESYTEGTIKKEKPTKKNAISTGYVPFNWGVLSPGYHTTTQYITNVEFILENKPYFRIQFQQTRGEGDDEGQSSPKTNIYISPSQWETIVQACNQARLEEITDEILEEANTF